MILENTFELDPRLAGSTHNMGTFAPHLNLRLVNDSRWPWLMLVPETAGIVELDDLSPPALADLTRSAAVLAAALRAVTGAPKTNIATIGNMVSQFHLHIVARHGEDPAWPDPVWGFGKAEPYAPEAAEGLRAALMDHLSRSGEAP